MADGILLRCHDCENEFEGDFEQAMENDGVYACPECGSETVTALGDGSD